MNMSNHSLVVYVSVYVYRRCSQPMLHGEHVFFSMLSTSRADAWMTLHPSQRGRELRPQIAPVSYDLPTATKTARR